MKRITVKFLILFVFTISVLFFSLILFQKNTMQREQYMQIPHNYDFFMQQQIPPPPKPKEPPLFIPFILIVLLSSSFVYVILKYLDKNFIAPLITIQDKTILWLILLTR